MKDAWLTFIGHLRPQMEVGMAIAEARRISNGLETQIRILAKEE